MKHVLIVICLLEITLSGTCMAGSFSDLEENAVKLLRYDSKVTGLLYGLVIATVVCLCNSFKHLSAVSTGWKKMLCLAFIAFCFFSGYRCMQAYDSLVSQINQYESAKVATSSDTDEQERIIGEFLHGFLSQNPQLCMNYVLPSIGNFK